MWSVGEIRSSENTYFCQAARQLSCVPSSKLCVKLASGGDPTYAFNIRFTGEEVHGTSEYRAPPPRKICPFFPLCFSDIISGRVHLDLYWMDQATSLARGL